MQRRIAELLAAVEARFESGPLRHLYYLFDATNTFLMTPDSVARRDAHVRDPMDMKRLMMTVIITCLPAMFVGMWNIGYQGYLGEGVSDPGVVSSILRGAWSMLPVYLVAYGTGVFWEWIFAQVRKHEINEGMFVTCFLLPLTLPPTIPLWMVAVATTFGIVIGKEVFGGTGMNILNPALTARAFIFFTYPSKISGAEVWDVAGKSPGWLTGGEAMVTDAYTGATPMLAVSSAGSVGEVVARAEAAGSDIVASQVGPWILEQSGWDFMDLFWGLIPGSMGETSTAAILLGGFAMVLLGVASWRIMTGTVVGLVAITLLFNLLAGPENNAYLSVPPHYHLVMGGFAFGAVFMATDPVSAAITIPGKWIYGIAIGVLCGLVRVVNPAYPEGMMLAILFMNVFAPLIDYYVLRPSRKRRAARLAAA